jgi:tRNA (cytidine/uridine-2'-O-)-methyltransferase
MGAMLEIVLVAPQIATNTGNIIRLCANTGGRLNLVRPLGFDLDGASLKRGGLDYHELTDTRCWDSWAECRAALGDVPRWFATTAAIAPCRYDEVEYRVDDVVVFGCESEGLPASLLGEFAPEQRLSIPMRPANRSLNLANAVSVILYEAWRQHGFAGAATDARGGFEESLRAAPHGSGRESS